MRMSTTSSVTEYTPSQYQGDIAPKIARPGLLSGPGSAALCWALVETQRAYDEDHEVNGRYRRLVDRRILCSSACLSLNKVLSEREQLITELLFLRLQAT